MPADGAAQVVARRSAQPFKNMGEVGALGVSAPRMGIGGNVIWTLRAAARLRRPDNSPSEVVRTSAAVVKLVDPNLYPLAPVHILRWYDDAWSQSAVLPAGVGPGISQSGITQPGAAQPGVLSQ
jgi:hypothetical protein